MYNYVTSFLKYYAFNIRNNIIFFTHIIIINCTENKIKNIFQKFFLKYILYQIYSWKNVRFDSGTNHKGFIFKLFIPLACLDVHSFLAQSKAKQETLGSWLAKQNLLPWNFHKFWYSKINQDICPSLDSPMCTYPSVAPKEAVC